MKKVLILCTGNSCRSIMAEGLVNRYFKGQIKAYSAGSDPSGKVNPNAKRVLEEENAWNESYHSKTIDEVEHFAPFDLVVTVCDSAKEACPMYRGAKKQLHLGFEDPEGKPYEAFVETKEAIKKRFFPLLKKELGIEKEKQ